MEDFGLLLVRVVIGALMLGHGAQKLFGWFGGYGIKGTGGWFESIGMRPGAFVAFLAGFTEVLSGVLLAAGLLTPVGGILLALTMLIALVKVHGPNGLWITNNGYEYNLVLLVVGVAFAFVGAGEYSLDAVLF